MASGFSFTVEIKKKRKAKIARHVDTSVAREQLTTADKRNDLDALSLHLHTLKLPTKFPYSLQKWYQPICIGKESYANIASECSDPIVVRYLNIEIDLSIG